MEWAYFVLLLANLSFSNRTHNSFAAAAPPTRLPLFRSSLCLFLFASSTVGCTYMHACAISTSCSGLLALAVGLLSSCACI
mmetsp:Transcript_30449/g.97248  ORF Transcript_30449/g.97248 Transcript_30449/m.97248 type:complete len:81 (+) Transcript_30449:1601-1843(+)